MLRCAAKGAARVFHCPPQQCLQTLLRGSQAPAKPSAIRGTCGGVCGKRRRLSVSATAAPELAPAGEQGATVEADVPEVAKLDIRIGKIVQIETHPDADSLFVEQVDVGEEEPRTIVSGLVKYVPIEAMQGRSVVVLCNLKPRNMRGVKSNGMLLCASDAAHENVEPLVPPEGAPVGERVRFGEAGASQPEAATPNQVQKKKIWEAVQPDLKTGADRVAAWQGAPMLTSAGAVTAATLANGSIS